MKTLSPNLAIATSTLKKYSSFQSLFGIFQSDVTFATGFTFMLYNVHHCNRQTSAPRLTPPPTESVAHHGATLGFHR